jgi:hypothetical protein
MRKMWRKIIGTAALTFMLCLTGLVITGEAQAQRLDPRFPWDPHFPTPPLKPQRFVDNGDGTVTDTETNLMWTKNADPFGRLNWHDAMSRCSSFSISGIGGWRLPSMDELVALYHAIRHGHPFYGVRPSVYWSSTTHAPNSINAWNVNMRFGFIQTNSASKHLTNHVWPVRAGQ